MQWAAYVSMASTTLPTDMIRELYGVLPARCWAVLAQTSRAFRDIFHALLAKAFYLRQAYAQQALLAKIFKESDPGTMTVQAELSFGKTTLGYMASGPFSVICAPSTVIKTWKDQGGPKNIGCVNSKEPQKSRYLIYSGAGTKMDAYVKGILDGKEPSDMHKGFLVIVCKDIHLVMVTRRVSKLAADAGQGCTVIVDEAHKRHSHVAGNLNVDKILYMSAMQMGIGDLNYSMRVERPKPTVAWLTKCVAPKENFADAIKGMTRLVGPKIVISATDNMVSRLGILQKKKSTGYDDWGEYKVFKLIGTCNTIAAFEKHDGPAILCINSANNEGLNIDADALFMLDPASINVARCTQTAGRIQRTSSTRAAVTAVLFGSPDDELRLYYTVIMARATTEGTPWSFPYNTLPDNIWLWKAFTLMKMLGVASPNAEVSDVADAAICLMHNGVEVAEEYVSWWKERRGPGSVLTEDKVRELCDVSAVRK